MDISNILANLGSGDELAFRWLYIKYRKLVWNIAYNMLHDRESARDIAQDVFARVWRKRQAFAAADNFVYLLIATTKRLVLNKIEKQNNARRFESMFLYLYGEKVSFIKDFNHTEDRFKIFLDRMSDTELEVFKLCKIDGKDYRIAAWRLCITVNTVKFHMKNIMKKLRPIGQSHQYRASTT